MDEMTTEAVDNAEAPAASDNHDWRDGLSEELRAEPTLANINDIESAAKTLVHQQKMMGNRIPLPKTDEEREELYTKLGRPESADKYEIEVPQGYEQYYPDQMVTSFKETGHKLGLSPDQMQGLIEWQKGSVDFQLNQEQMAGQTLGSQTEEALKQEFGGNYEKNMTAAKRALAVYGNEALAEKLANPAIGNDPDLIRLLANAGKDITEDSATGTANNSLVMSPMDAKMKIDQINGDKAHPYWDAKNPKHHEAQEEMQQLFAKAFH